jgi:hypothetical protein
MFRRFQGKVLVAIFVYRPTIPGGGVTGYNVPPNPSPNQAVGPIPVHVSLVVNATADAWDAGAQIVNGTAAGGSYDRQNQGESWQEPGQWLLDQNNNVFRVLSRKPATNTVAADVELLRPIPALPDVASLFVHRDGIGPVVEGVENIVSNIWYVPVEVVAPTAGAGNPTYDVLLTPIYVMVREL